MFFHQKLEQIEAEIKGKGRGRVIISVTTKLIYGNCKYFQKPLNGVKNIKLA